MKRIALIAAGALAASALVSAPAFAQTPFDGKWAVDAKTDFGTFKSHWTVAEKDGAPVVEMEDEPMAGMPPMSGTISDVKVDGNTITFKRELNMGDMPMMLDYTATVEGDTLTGTANSSFGPTPITGTRE